VELRQLEHFLAVVKEGSFTRAAAELYMVQSSLSGSLLGLERELGAQLFTRGPRGAELTEAGRAFLGHARTVIAEAEQGRDAVAAVKGLVRGSVRVAAVALPRDLGLAETIRWFRDEHPGADLHVVPTSARRAARLVNEGEADFAVAPLPPGAPPALRFERLASTPLAVACPVGHRLAGAHAVDPAELLDEFVIDLARGWWARELFDRMMEERGLQRRVCLEVTDWSSALALVQRDVGLAYTPLGCVDRETFAGIAMATLADAPLWDLGVVTRADGPRGPAGRAFLTGYLQRCRSRPGPGSAPGRTPATTGRGSSRLGSPGS
jgi:DNA-binding transcriptional LysR family regulator